MNTMRWMSRAGVAGMIVLLAACAAVPSGKPPAMPEPAQYGTVPTPAQTVAAQGTAQHFESQAAPVPDWWTRFGSPELDALVAEGLAHSPTLAAADASLAAAREQLRGRIGESLLPSIDAGAQADRQRALGLPGQVPPTILYNTFVGQVRAEYSFDLFGSARYGNAALAARIDQQTYQFDAARRAVAANIVTGAIGSAALGKQVQLVEQQAVLARQVAHDTQRRYELGSASQQDALDADQNASVLEAALPGLRSQWQSTRHALAVLLGRTPDQAPPDLDFDRLVVPDRVPLAVPSQLLAARPDVRAADAAVKAAAADVGVATARMLPNLSISASMGQGGFDWSTAVSSEGGIWSVGAALTQPLFHGGALRAQRRASLHSYDAATDQYRQTVLAAFQDVADTLAALQAGNEALAAAEAARTAAEGSFHNTARRVELGALPGYAGRAAEQHYLDARVRELRYATDRLTETAALFHAMGN